MIIIAVNKKLIRDRLKSALVNHGFSVYVVNNKMEMLNWIISREHCTKGVWLLVLSAHFNNQDNETLISTMKNIPPSIPMLLLAPATEMLSYSHAIVSSDVIVVSESADATELSSNIYSLLESRTHPVINVADEPGQPKGENHEE